MFSRPQNYRCRRFTSIVQLGRTTGTERWVVRDGKSCNFCPIRVSQEQINAAAAGIRLARTSYLPRVDALALVNRATRNNVFGILLPQSVIPSVTGPVLSPAAATKVKNFEKRYAELMRTIHQAQRQMDREFNRILRQIKVHRSDVNKVVAQQKDKLEKASTVLKKRFTKKAAGKPVATVVRKAKTAARKRRKA